MAKTKDELILRDDGTTKKMACTCQHVFQDQAYGKGVRVHNRKLTVKGTPAQWTCTVCGRTR